MPTVYPRLEDSVAQNAEAIDFDFHTITCGHRTDAGRCAGGDQVAGLERHAGGDVDEQVRDEKDEVPRSAILLPLAVQAGFEHEASGGIYLAGDDWAAGAEGIKALGAGPLAIGLLQVARGDVVHDGIAADVGAEIGVRLQRAG